MKDSELQKSKNCKIALQRGFDIRNSEEGEGGEFKDD
jgi:hypothetical protein